MRIIEQTYLDTIPEKNNIQSIKLQRQTGKEMVISDAFSH